ncbi:hypothetical protein EUGRSUZ_H01965 [Eucalyptus grandis]|uniref:Uncharacterized protein n=2 Tax=Eucalyptus grandis TaxID=71139 RepID=A0ACC3JPX6_EUCGR|nr:hypothetical protein EUGRSUZ_H01965 [Eucalyptus grandis]
MVGRGYFESQTPHFFKIVLSDALQNGRLGIPKKFVRKYGSSLSDLVFLHLASGDVWEVELLRGNDGAFLRRGWPDFVKHYAIEHGHFLVFRYEGGSAFRVVIFDKSATEIKYPLVSENDDPRMEEDVGDASVEVFEDHSDQVSEKSEALERATSFQSPNPFFLAIMQPSFIRHCLSAPARFFMKYIPNFRSKGDIILYVSDERFWSVRYKFGIYGRRRQIKFNCGWKRFVQDNNLKLGDVCVFEIMWKVHQISFRVLIFRANGDTVEFGRGHLHVKLCFIR